MKRQPLIGILLRAALGVLFLTGALAHVQAKETKTPPTLKTLQTAEQKVAFSSKALMAHVEHLAAPALQGRRAGSAFERQAAEYLAKQLEAKGVGPLPGGNRYQRFSIAQWQRGLQSLNVLGWIGPEGKKNADDLLVLGAHLDHLGRADDGGYYPGADDNASGVAVVLEVAGALQKKATSLRRPVVVVFFGSEEIGLIGSRQFVRSGPLANDRIAAMVNVDGVGRAIMDRAELAPIKKFFQMDTTNGILVIGTKGRPLFTESVEAACRDARVVPLGTQDVPTMQDIFEQLSRNRADHCSFEQAGIPSIFFTSGISDDYHRPSDTADRLLPETLARRAHAVYATILALAAAPREKLPPRTKPSAVEERPKVSPSSMHRSYDSSTRFPSHRGFRRSRR
ncbi:MAG: M20/M25/M40 family metallo-hydrolase [Pirellulales bacterium]|nr:M20/M25/M40 family metallo-hydrolase [Pirellulales bacterium]